MTTTTAVITARMGSRRLPGKCMMDIEGHPMLWHVIERVKACNNVDNIMLAVSNDSEDWQLTRLAGNGVFYTQGANDDVLERITFGCSFDKTVCDIVVRICGDAPLFCPNAVDALVTELKRCMDAEEKVDYIGFGNPSNHAGFDVARFWAVQQMDKLLKPGYHWREHGFAHMIDMDHIFYSLMFKGPYERSFPKLTVDTQEDLDRVRGIYAKLYKEGEVIKFDDVQEMFKIPEEVSK